MNSFKPSDLCNFNNQKLNFAIFEKSKLHVFYRGGIILEFVRNSFDLKFVIRLIGKGKKYSKNSMKINLD